jgi:gas vesicle protein
MIQITNMCLSTNIIQMTIQKGMKIVSNLTKEPEEQMEHEQNEPKKSKFILGTVIGAAVGAVSTLLLTPKSGAKMREDISDKYNSINKKTQQYASDAGRKTQEMAKNVKDQTSELVGKAKNAKDKVMNAGNSAVNAAQSELESNDESQDRSKLN